MCGHMHTYTCYAHAHIGNMHMLCEYRLYGQHIYNAVILNTLITVSLGLTLSYLLILVVSF